MTCNSDTLQLYLVGQLRDKALMDFLDHVEKCKKCRRVRTYYVKPKRGKFTRTESDVNKTKAILEAVCNSNKLLTSTAVTSMFPDFGEKSVNALLGQLVKRGDLKRSKNENGKYRYYGNGYDPTVVATAEPIATQPKTERRISAKGRIKIAGAIGPKTKQISEMLCNSERTFTSAEVSRIFPEFGESNVSWMLGQLVKRGELKRFKAEDGKFRYHDPKYMAVTAASLSIGFSDGVNNAVSAIPGVKPEVDKPEPMPEKNTSSSVASNEDEKKEVPEQEPVLAEQEKSIPVGLVIPPGSSILMKDTSAMLEAVMERYDEMERALQDAQQHVVIREKQIREMEQVIASRDASVAELTLTLHERIGELEQLKAGVGTENSFRKWFSRKGLTMFGQAAGD